MDMNSVMYAYRNDCDSRFGIAFTFTVRES
jgi:hypothetical protein